MKLFKHKQLHLNWFKKKLSFSIKSSIPYS